MNIFVLDKDPWEIPKHYMDIHVNKMLLESCQLLATAIRVAAGTKTEVISPYTGKIYTVWLLPEETYSYGAYIEQRGNKKNYISEKLILSSGLPKQTHINHPCAKWARESQSNYIWLCELANALMCEFRKRRNKDHAWETILDLLDNETSPYFKYIPNLKANSLYDTPKNIWEVELTMSSPWPQVMPDEFKCNWHYCDEFDGLKLYNGSDEEQLCCLCHSRYFNQTIHAYRRYYAAKIKEFKKRGICKFTKKELK